MREFLTLKLQYLNKLVQPQPALLSNTKCTKVVFFVAKNDLYQSRSCLIITHNRYLFKTTYYIGYLKDD